MSASPRALCALWIAGLVAAAGCRPEDAPPVATEVLREGVDMVMYELRTYVTREGIRNARIEADTAEFVGETEIHMRPVTLTFFAEDGTESTQITADYGVYYELTEDMNAEGSVVAIDRVDDQRLETEQLRYVNADDRLYGDVAFTMWSDGGRTVMRGDSFQSDPGMDSVTVRTPSGQTEQVVRAADEPPLETPAAPIVTPGAVDSLAATVDSVARAVGVDEPAAATVDSVARAVGVDEPPAATDTVSAPPDTTRRSRPRS